MNNGIEVLLMGGALAILFGAAGAFLYTRLVTQPLARLQKAMEQVTRGDLSARATATTHDQIGDLARSFNQMAARLEQSIHALSQRDAEHTRELDAARLHFQASNAYLSALSETSGALFRRLDLDELLHAIVERAGALMDTPHGYVFFVEPGQGEIQMRVGLGLYDDLVGTRAQRGVGFAGTVWQTGEPFAVDDYQKWEGRLPGTRRDALRAIVGVPLKRASRDEAMHAETIGVIGLAYTDEARKFGSPQIEILQRFAQLASLALDNAELYASSERRVQELGALNRISQLVIEQGDSQTVIERAGDEVYRIFDADFAYVALYDAIKEQVEFPYVADDGKRVQMDPLPTGTGITWQVIHTGQPVLFSHATAQDYERVGAIDSGDGTSPRSLVAVPIRVGEKIIGVLSVQRVELDEPFTEADTNLLTTIATAIASAIQKARLLEQTQNALLETQRLAEQARQSADQVSALNRRLTREGWHEFLDPLRSSLVVEATEQENGNGKLHASQTGSNGDGVNQGENHVRGSTVRVPIQLRGEVIGEIELEQDGAESALGEDEMGLVTHIAENIGLALDNARLFSETQRRVTELDALNSITQFATTELDLDSLLNIIGDQLCAIFRVQNAYIALYDRTSQMISLPYFFSDNQRATPEPMPYGAGITSHIIRTREPLVINSDSERRMAELGARVFGNPAQTYLGVPIILGEDVTGVISIQSTTRERAFDDTDVRLLETIAATVGAAIQNAQLYGAMQQEVITRQRAEQEITLSLKEKEVLLKEIHHRVKNNLQIITSLLNLQSAQIKDPDAIMLFRESQSRVRSMALIHEKLYQSKDLARIDFESYLRDLIVYLFRSYAANPEQIRAHIQSQDMFLGIDTAIPCGLIISELVTNALKYAFPQGRRGNLDISLAPEDDGHLCLLVKDDGVGFPPNFDWRESDSLGLQLVSTLSSQLHGTIHVDGVNGTSFKITFPG